MKQNALFVKLSEFGQKDERLEFISFLAHNPFVGDVVPKSGGLRKVRWTTQNKGKSGGVRVIYFNRLDNGVIVCTYIYVKNQTANIAPDKLKALKE